MHSLSLNNAIWPFLLSLIISFGLVCSAFAGTLAQDLTIRLSPNSNNTAKLGYTGDIVLKIKSKALILPELSALVAFTLSPNPTSIDIQNFLQSFDKWATWTDKHDMLQNQLTSRNYGSIGMLVARNKAGKTICIPYPNSPAERAGIMAGDILLLGERSIANATKSFAGLVGDPVRFYIERNNTTLEFNIVREKFVRPHVQFSQHDGFARIRIWYFDLNTPKLFEEQLEKVGNQPLVIDVRSNSGGNILAARNCAAKFLSENTLLGLARVRADEQDHTLKEKRISTTKDGDFMHMNKLFIWQDDFTASSAEAFIIALVDTGRATNMGIDTFGKAHAQSVFNIDGNELILTTEALLRPLGQSWDGWGIAPNFVSYDTSVGELVQRTRGLILEQGMPYY